MSRLGPTSGGLCLAGFGTAHRPEAQQHHGDAQNRGEHHQPGQHRGQEGAAVGGDAGLGPTAILDGRGGPRGGTGALRGALGSSGRGCLDIVGAGEIRHLARGSDLPDVGEAPVQQFLRRRLSVALDPEEGRNQGVSVPFGGDDEGAARLLGVARLTAEDAGVVVGCQPVLGEDVEGCPGLSGFALFAGELVVLVLHQGAELVQLQVGAEDLGDVVDGGQLLGLV